MPIQYRPVDQKTLILESMKQKELEEKKEAQAIKEAKAAERAHDHQMGAILESHMTLTQRRDRYAGFTEQLRTSLVEFAISRFCMESMRKCNENLGKEFTHYDESTIHALTYEFIRENGGPSAIVNKMGGPTASMFLNEVSEIIKTNFKAMLEEVNPDDPDTFNVSSDTMESYKKEISDENLDAISDTIAGRVAEAVKTFIDQNARDKNQIVNILTATKEKIDSVQGEDEDQTQGIKESYASLGRCKVSEIRNRKKGLFTEMVTAMTEGVLKDKDMRKEFMTEDNHINMDKIVNKITLMYGFLETVNTMRLVTINESYIKDLIDSMSKFSPT